MKVNDHVYQFAIRRASDEKKQFIIETDTVYSEVKLKELDLMRMSEQYQCDVQITYLGKLMPPKNEEIISVEYHTKDQIEQKLTQWHNEKEIDNKLKEIEERELRPYERPSL